MSRLCRSLLSFAALLSAVAMPVRAEDKPLVSSTTEDFLTGGVQPPATLNSFIIKTMGSEWQDKVDDCLADKDLDLRKNDYAKLFQTVQIKSSPRHSLWFVRPTTEPYCTALYGAHLFNYFLVEQYSVSSKFEYRLVFRNGGDGFAIYRHLSHGLNDIEATGCIAIACRAVRMEFDGQRYRPVRCTLTRFDKDQTEIKLTRVCGSDDGRDDQASGFNPSDR